MFDHNNNYYYYYNYFIIFSMFSFQYLLCNKLIDILIFRQKVFPPESCLQPHRSSLFVTLRIFQRRKKILKLQFMQVIFISICRSMVLTSPLQRRLSMSTSKIAALPIGSRGLDTSLWTGLFKKVRWCVNAFFFFLLWWFIVLHTVIRFSA